MFTVSVLYVWTVLIVSRIYHALFGNQQSNEAVIFAYKKQQVVDDTYVT